MGTSDPFDPRTWEPAAPTRPVFLGPHADKVCWVDAIDYDWVMQWQWFYTSWGPRTKAARRGWRMKHYAVRHTTMFGIVWMHKEILLRKREPWPSPAHTIGDHLDGESLNNTRSNLRWATSQMNGRNPFGFASLQLELF